MERFADIIERWPGHAEFEADLCLKRGTAAVWKHRDSIPPAAWPALVDKARSRGIDGVSLEFLHGLAARKAARDHAPEAA